MDEHDEDLLRLTGIVDTALSEASREPLRAQAVLACHVARRILEQWCVDDEPDELTERSLDQLSTWAAAR